MNEWFYDASFVAAGVFVGMIAAFLAVSAMDRRRRRS